MTPEAPRTPPFWVVRRMQPGGLTKRGNFFRHPTRATAEAEAARLSEQQPGVQFVVLEAVASFGEASFGREREAA